MPINKKCDLEDSWEFLQNKAMNEVQSYMQPKLYETKSQIRKLLQDLNSTLLGTAGLVHPQQPYYQAFRLLSPIGPRLLVCPESPLSASAAMV